MTGTNWNGHRFFGLRQGKNDAAGHGRDRRKGRGERRRENSAWRTAMTRRSRIIERNNGDFIAAALPMTASQRSIPAPRLRKRKLRAQGNAIGERLRDSRHVGRRLT